MCTLDKKLIFLAIVMVPIGYILLSCYLSNEESFKHSTPLYGQDSEQNDLLNKILGESHKIVEVVGIAGVGKTFFVRNIAEKLISKYGYCVIYIEVSKHHNISSVLNYLINDHKCTMSCIAGYFLVSLTQQKVDDDNNNANRSFSIWYESLKANTVLILDGVDTMIDDVDHSIIEPLQSTPSTIKIIQVSRHSKIKYLKRHVIPLMGLNSSTCATWISSEFQQINYTKGKQLCDTLGGVPRELESIATYVTHPLTPGSIDDIIDELNDPNYGKAYQYLEDLWNNYEDTRYQPKSMYLLYARLNHEHRTCIWMLVEIKSDAFTRDTVVQHLENTNISADSCLDTLLTHSFLEIVSFVPRKLFKFRSYIKKFIESIGEPEHDTRSTSIQAKYFYGNYVQNNARNLHAMLKNKRDHELAINIGSNRRLVNTFLPLLGRTYELKPLFKMALIVIEDHYCIQNGMQKSSNAKALLAFSYLTKALHCPQIHPPTMLSQPKSRKLMPKPNSCFRKLSSCPSILSLEKDDYESAEALGYYNSLLVYAVDETKLVPWQLFLTDLSFIVTLANQECVQYCMKTSYCQCGKKISLEHGLRLFLVRNHALSARYFQTTLYHLSKNSQPCQTILKTIAIAGIYASTSEDATHHLLESINFNNLNVSCFLGVMYDLIVPFLSEINYNESQSLRNRLSSIIRDEEERCNKDANTNEERLDCRPKFRYSLAHGVTALKMKELQESLKWPQEITEYSSREEWVCSIIRDKTTKCKEDLPPFSQVRLLETNKNYERLWVMQYFMDKAEFEELFEKAKIYSKILPIYVYLDLIGKTIIGYLQL